MPSTDSKHGGFKITATLSVLEDLLVSAHITDARRHDRKAFELPADRRGVWWIADRGYSGPVVRPLRAPSTTLGSDAKGRGARGQGPGVHCVHHEQEW